MKIKQIDKMGDMAISEVLRHNDGRFFYRTLYFNFSELTAGEFDSYNRFLDEKIDLTQIAPNENAILMIRHSACSCSNPDKTRIEHAVTLLASRILTSSALLWSYVKDKSIDFGEYKFDIILPVAETKPTLEEILKKNPARDSEQNHKPARKNWLGAFKSIFTKFIKK